MTFIISDAFCLKFSRSDTNIAISAFSLSIFLCIEVTFINTLHLHHLVLFLLSLGVRLLFEFKPFTFMLLRRLEDFYCLIGALLCSTFLYFHLISPFLLSFHVKLFFSYVM